MTDSSKTQSKHANPLVNKLNKVLSIKIENDEELINAFKACNSFCENNNLRNRRALRSQIEVRGIEIHRRVLAEMTLVKDKFDELERKIEKMNENCQEMNDRLLETKKETQELLTNATHTQSECEKLDIKSKMAQNFIKHFQLSESEINCIKALCDEADIAQHRQHTHTALTPQFFATLTRIHEINENCKLLLRSTNQTIGLEIIESMAGYTETVYNKLFVWTQRQLQTLSASSVAAKSAEGDATAQRGEGVGGGAELYYELCRAMAALQERPILFKYALDEYAGARRHAVLQAFLAAFNLEEWGAETALLEEMRHRLSAHFFEAPVRFASDLLACVHQSTAGEFELLSSLLRLCTTFSPEEKSLFTECLNRIMQSISAPFKILIEQLLIEIQDPVYLYKINHVLKFYRHTLQQIMMRSNNDDDTITTNHHHEPTTVPESPPPHNHLIGCLNDVIKLNETFFFSTLEDCVRNLLGLSESSVGGATGGAQMSSDLTPNPAFLDCLKILQDILSSESISILPPPSQSSTNASSNQGEEAAIRTEFQKIIGSVLDPALKHCSVMASRGAANPLDAVVFLLNCLHSARLTLAKLAHSQLKLEQVQLDIDTHLSALIGEQAGHILYACGLAPLYQALSSASSSGGPPLSVLPASLASPAVLRNAALKFDGYLADPDSLMMPPVLYHLAPRNPRMAASIRRRSADLVHSAYSMIYEAVANTAAAAGAGSAAGELILHRTPDQVAQLILDF